MKITIIHFLATIAATAAEPATPGLLTFSGYVDAYFSRDFDDSSVGDRQVMPSGVTPVYSHGRNNELNLNHALVDAKYATESVRAGLGVQAGTYVDANYAAESQTMRHLYEAVAGFKLGDGLWLDAGIFSSHIGMESAVSRDNWALTRSLVADNTPYFETGAKVTYDPNPKWTLSALVLNGWQNIRDNNSNKAVGTQIQFKPASSLVFNYSTFFGEGRNAPDSDRRLRYFHDFHFTAQLSPRVSVGGQFDIGFEHESATDHRFNEWYSGMAIARCQLSDRFATAVRAEFYQDPDGVIIATGTRRNFIAHGGSIGLDYAPAKNSLFRIELRTLRADRAVFVHSNGPKNRSTYLTSSISLAY